MTLFHPHTGRVEALPVGQATNAILHPWLKERLTEILSCLPALPPEAREQPGRRFSDWGYSEEAQSEREWPPVRLLLIWDNLAGHLTPELVVWLISQGVAPLYTPLGGSWLNMAESIQRILVRRALSGQHPRDAEEVKDWLAATVRGWNADPTPFVWGGKRWQRRARFRERYRQGGARCYAGRAIRRRWQAEGASKGVCSLA